MEKLLYCISLSVLVFINVTLATGKLEFPIYRHVYFIS
jgi:hypothetical protein